MEIVITDWFSFYFQTCAKETVIPCIVMKQDGLTELSVKMNYPLTSPRKCVVVQRRVKPGTLLVKFVRTEIQVRKTTTLLRIITKIKPVKILGLNVLLSTSSYDSQLPGAAIALFILILVVEEKHKKHNSLRI